jgi:hypothetical protein
MDSDQSHLDSDSQLIMQAAAGSPLAIGLLFDVKYGASITSEVSQSYKFFTNLLHRSDHLRA